MSSADHVRPVQKQFYMELNSIEGRKNLGKAARSTAKLTSCPLQKVFSHCNASILGLNLRELESFGISPEVSVSGARNGRVFSRPDEGFHDAPLQTSQSLLAPPRRLLGPDEMVEVDWSDFWVFTTCSPSGKGGQGRGAPEERSLRWPTWSGF